MKKRQETIEDKLKRGSKLDPNTGCINWVGPKDGGYGRLWIPGRGDRKVHILAWECIYGSRPEGFIIQHTCGNKLCINSNHMLLFKSSALEDDIEGQLDRLKRKIIINPSTHCWEWQSAKTDKGYGILYVGKRRAYAHRLMWECMFGEINDLHVLHKCDNPGCIRPDHLFLGTHAKNMRDMAIKNRAARKLNLEAVQDIRTSELSPKKLAKKYKVTVYSIYNVLNRKTWKHIE